MEALIIGILFFITILTATILNTATQKNTTTSTTTKKLFQKITTFDLLNPNLNKLITQQDIQIINEDLDKVSNDLTNNLSPITVLNYLNTSTLLFNTNLTIYKNNVETFLNQVLSVTSNNPVPSYIFPVTITYILKKYFNNI